MCTAFVPNIAFGIGEPVVDGDTRDPVQSPSFGVEVPGEEDPAARDAMMAASAALSMVGESERLETEEAEAARTEKREEAYLKKRARDMINGEAKLLERLDKYAKTRVYRAAEVASEWEAMDQAPARENRAPFDFPTRGEGAASGSGGGGAPAPAPPRGPEHRAPVDLRGALQDLLGEVTCEQQERLKREASKVRREVARNKEAARLQAIKQDLQNSRRMNAERTRKKEEEWKEEEEMIIHI